MSAPDTSAATSAAPLPGPLSSVSGAVQGGVSSLVTTVKGFIDRFFPPEKREAWKEWLIKFATEKPALASFLLSQLALSGPPLALFMLMTITVVVFALLAGILVGLIGALLFIVAAVGFALIIVLPVLFFTTGAAVFFWLWGMGTYYIIKWFNEKPVPGVNSDMAGGLAEASGIKDLPGMNGAPVLGEKGTDMRAKAEADAADEKEEEKKEKEDRPPKLKERPAKEGGHGQGKTTGAQHRGDGQENANGASPAQRKAKKTGSGGGEE